MKLMGVVLILLGCTISGFVIDAMEKKRIEELENFIYLFQLLKREIAYHLTPLGEACQSISRFALGSVKEVFRGFESRISSKASMDIERMWEETLQVEARSMSLKSEDYVILKGFGKACGYLDQEMQEKNIEMVIEALKEKSSTLKVRYEKTTKLNKYLGFFIGACISIFLI